MIISRNKSSYVGEAKSLLLFVCEMGEPKYLHGLVENVTNWFLYGRPSVVLRVI